VTKALCGKEEKGKERREEKKKKERRRLSYQLKAAFSEGHHHL